MSKWGQSPLDTLKVTEAQRGGMAYPRAHSREARSMSLPCSGREAEPTCCEILDETSDVPSLGFS